MNEEPVELVSIFEALSAAVQQSGADFRETVGSVDLDPERGVVQVWLRGGPPGLEASIERSLARLPGIVSARVTRGGGEPAR